MDFTYLILTDTIWFLFSLVLYYFTTFFKVHLIWENQPRIWNVFFDKNLFKDYPKSLVNCFLTKRSCHLGALQYIFTRKESKFVIIDSSKLNTLVKYSRRLKSFTEFLRIYLFFAAIFAVFRYFIEKQFFYNELKITLGEIQQMLNALSNYAPLSFVAENKYLIILFFTVLLLFVPPGYSGDVDPPFRGH